MNSAYNFNLLLWTTAHKGPINQYSFKMAEIGENHSIKYKIQYKDTVVYMPLSMAYGQLLIKAPFSGSLKWPLYTGLIVLL
jgi:hypothetical protein